MIQRFLCLAFLAVTLSQQAYASEVDPAHRACVSDADCRVLLLKCACIHNPTCARSEDVAQGIVDSVNKNFAKQYEALSRCTDAERRQCATAGPCASRGARVPKCDKGTCTVFFRTK